MNVAVLFARADSVYKSFPSVEVFDAERDAKTYQGEHPVVAHPPCRAWGQLRFLANPLQGEKELALWAVDKVRECGGVLEHPISSTLFNEKEIPTTGEADNYGGWCLPISQKWWGHKAEKKTLLYICGIDKDELPSFPLSLGESSHVCGSAGRRTDGSRLLKGDIGWRPEITKAEREQTPIKLAEWLVNLAARCKAYDPC